MLVDIGNDDDDDDGSTEAPHMIEQSEEAATIIQRTFRASRLSSSGSSSDSSDNDSNNLSNQKTGNEQEEEEEEDEDKKKHKVVLSLSLSPSSAPPSKHPAAASPPPPSPSASEARDSFSGAAIGDSPFAPTEDAIAAASSSSLPLVGAVADRDTIIMTTATASPSSTPMTTSTIAMTDTFTQHYYTTTTTLNDEPLSSSLSSLSAIDNGQGLRRRYRAPPTPPNDFLDNHQLGSNNDNAPLGDDPFQQTSPESTTQSWLQSIREEIVSAVVPARFRSETLDANHDTIHHDNAYFAEHQDDVEVNDDDNYDDNVTSNNDDTDTDYQSSNSLDTTTEGQNSVMTGESEGYFAATEV